MQLNRAVSTMLQTVTLNNIQTYLFFIYLWTHFFTFTNGIQSVIRCSITQFNFDIHGSIRYSFILVTSIPYMKCKSINIQSFVYILILVSNDYFGEFFPQVLLVKMSKWAPNVVTYTSDATGTHLNVTYIQHVMLAGSLIYGLLSFCIKMH